MAFRVGQKVTPIACGHDPDPFRTLPRIPMGTVVIIREIDGRAIGIPGHTAACLRFVGIYGTVKNTTVGIWETGYSAEYFRPVVETSTETGMAILREILDRESHVIKTPAKA